MTTKELGDLGERFAIQCLQEKGYKIVTTNYRYLRNEVDIICEEKEQLIFIEVKTRQTAQIGPPWKAVNRHKQKQIIKCAHQYLVSKDDEREARFDIVSIVHNSKGTFIEHIEDAFYPFA
jgi:putative endonuclease